MNDERAQREIDQKHESEFEKDLERFQDRSSQDEQNLVERATLIDILSQQGPLNESSFLFDHLTPSKRPDQRLRNHLRD